MILGDKVKQLREARKLSQAALAKLVGVSQPTIVAIEAGGQETTKALPRLASVLEVDVWEISPDFPKNVNLSLEQAGTAYNVMLEFLRRDLNETQRKALERVFLDLVQEPLDDTFGGDIAAQMKANLRIWIRAYQLP